MKRVAITLLALASTASVCAQQVYKWVDQDGTVHFTDSPPEQTVNAERVVLRGNVASTINELPERGVSADELDLLYTPDQRRAACEQARANRTTLQNMPIVMTDLDGDGTAEQLTEDQRTSELLRAQQQVDLLCTDNG